jgi:hypothetical protein
VQPSSADLTHEAVVAVAKVDPFPEDQASLVEVPGNSHGLCLTVELTEFIMDVIYSVGYVVKELI